MNDLLVMLKKAWGGLKANGFMYYSEIWIFIGTWIFLCLCVVVAMIIIPLKQAGEL